MIIRKFKIGNSSSNDDKPTKIPEINLWARVLDCAIRDALKWKSSKARAWFFSGETEEYSFLWVCDVLKIDPAPIKLIIKERRIEILKKL